jgi:serine/threonine-protein kinase
VSDPLSQVADALAGRYHIEKELGRGGMATVYLARDLKHDRPVALKVMHPDLRLGSGTERFLREIRTTARLDHPHILPVHDSGEAQDLLWYTMPYVEGASLRDRLMGAGPLPMEDVLQLGREVADALDYAHQHGVVHRDIKPENVLLAGGHARVADFGIATALEAAAGARDPRADRLTGTGITVGTPAYMSPEQAAGARTLDGRSDIYSLGCMLYEMLAGEPPFTGSTPQAVIARRFAKPPPSVRQLRPAVPPAVEEVLSRALAREPADRFQTAAALGQALARTPHATSAPRSRFGIRAALVAVALLASVSMGVSYLLQRTRPRPVASASLAAGAPKQRERVILADFKNGTRDSLLGASVTEAFRVDFAQSPAVKVMSETQIGEVLGRMKRAPTDPLDLSTAREVAAREGLKAVVTGEVSSAGAQYILSVRLVSVADGEILAAHRVTARDSTELIDAVDRLSKQLRASVGESLKTIRASPRLQRVTTGSLAALRKFAQAARADREGDPERNVALLSEAVALDTGFALAYASLGVAMLNNGASRERAEAQSRKALAHLDRLTERERLVLLAGHYIDTYEIEKAVAAYRSLLAVYPDDIYALHSLGIIYRNVGEYEKAEPLFRRVASLDTAGWQPLWNLVWVYAEVGKRREAESTFERLSRKVPGIPIVQESGILLASTAGDYADAEARAIGLRDGAWANPDWRASGSEYLAWLALVRGRLDEAERHWHDVREARVQAGDATAPIAWALSVASLRIRQRGDTGSGLALVDSVLRRHPLESSRPADRTYYPQLASLYASAGRVRRARALLGEFERTVSVDQRREHEPARHLAWGEVAIAEGRYEDAIVELRERRGWSCRICGLPQLARSYDSLGRRDSAIAILERYVSIPDFYRVSTDADELAPIYRRLAQLHAEGGNRETARDYYARFVKLWATCDPLLRPQLTEARQRSRT